MRAILQQAISNSRRRENYLMERRIREMNEEGEQEYLELSAPLQNSIEIGESSKGELYLKSLKLYWGTGTVEGEMAVDKIFELYDRAKKQINARRG